MRITFVTTQSTAGSTIIGRIFPLARSLSTTHDIHLLGLGKADRIDPGLAWHTVGREPWRRSPHGKIRYRGVRLILNMMLTACRIAYKLHQLQPDTIIIVKPLPANVLGVKMYHIIHSHTPIILDTDDFELLSNHLTSLMQRASIHWSERTSVALARVTIAATPFLVDHFCALDPSNHSVVLIPTGYTPVRTTLPSPSTSTPTLLYLGSISLGSGHRVDLLPEILTLVKQQEPDIRLIIAGTGDDVEELKALFASANLLPIVEWFGRFTSDNVPTLIARAHVLVDPVGGSITERAKSSFRVAAAAAYGIPIVTSNIGIRPYFLPPALAEQCFAEPNQAHDYATKIVSLLRQPLSAQQKQGLQQKSASYEWSVLAAQYNKYITSP
ncbi:MAG: glycosyltransferase family 4 protein [Candidatus Andersenbacteria bacterium]